MPDKDPIVYNLNCSDIQCCLKYSMYSNCLISNGTDSVHFWDPSTNFEQTITLNNILAAKLLQKARANTVFTVSSYISSDSAAVCNSNGDLLYFLKSKEWTYEKEFPRMHTSKITGIEVLESEKVIITCSTDGCIHIYSFTFKLLCTIEKYNLGPILTIGVGLKNGMKSHPNLPSLIVASESGAIVHVEGAENEYTIHSKCMEFKIQCIALHKKHAMLAAASAGGEVISWDYIEKTIDSVGKVNGAVTTLLFHPEERFLYTFTLTGQMFILGESLELVSDVVNVSHGFAIQKAMFSPKHGFIVCSDVKFTITILKCITYTNFENILRINSHSDEIIGIWFAAYSEHESIMTQTSTPLYEKQEPVEGKDFLKFCTISKDRTIVAYIASGNTLNATIHKIEQTAVPTAAYEVPNVKRIAITTNQMHLKLFNAETLVCRKTSILPGFMQQQVKWIRPFTSAANGKDYLAIALCSKIVVLLKVPYDGNPFWSSGIIVSHDTLCDVLVSANGEHMFTVGLGGPTGDSGVKMWSVNPNALEAQTSLVKDEMEVIQTLLNPQNNPAFMEQAKYLFYYAQIKDQGEDFQGKRMLSTLASLKQLPDLMRALGNFSSEQEMKKIVQEVALDLLEKNREAKFTLDEWLKRTYI